MSAFRFVRLATLTAALAAASAGAFAFDAARHDGPRFGDRRAEASRIDQRQARQEQRIEHALRSGRLNPHEVQRLRREQAEIRAAERHAFADGRLTPREAARIDQMQDRADARIARLANDRRVAYHR